MNSKADLRRVELDASNLPVAIPTQVVHELCRHAIEAYPEECCGLVTGSRMEGQTVYQTVHRCTNIMTKMHLDDPEAFPRDAHQAYYMSEIEYMKTQQEAEQNGEFVSAVYHSHVGAGAYLSEDDLKFAEHVLFPFPEAAQIVLGVSDGGVEEKGIFLCESEDGEFVGYPIEVIK